MYTNNVVEKLEAAKSETFTKVEVIKDLIASARRHCINTELYLNKAQAAIDLSVEPELRDKVTEYVQHGKGDLQDIVSDLMVYYDVEIKLRCYRELK